MENNNTIFWVVLYFMLGFLLATVVIYQTAKNVIREDAIKNGVGEYYISNHTNGVTEFRWKKDFMGTNYINVFQNYKIATTNTVINNQ